MFPHLIDHLRVGRPGAGCPRMRPVRVRADMGEPSHAIRTHLHERGVEAVIPQPADQIGHRIRCDSRGGRPPCFDRDDYKNRNVVERNFATFKQWRGLATRYDKLAITNRGGAVLRAITIWSKA